MGASAYADHHSSDHHHHSHSCEFKGGSFVSVRPSNTEDQFIFNSDGTVFWNQSTDLVFPNTTGTHGPEVGAWKVKGCYVIATTIGYSAAPVQVGTCCDVDVTFYTRSTQKFKIIDKDTLRAVHRVFRDIPFGQDPLNDSGTVALDSTTEFELHKVKVKVSDL